MRKPPYPVTFHENDEDLGAGGSLAADRAFVVQFLNQPASDAKCLRGRVEHLVSGEARRFRSTSELIEFVLRTLTGLAH